jgi:hypothetical protein
MSISAMKQALEALEKLANETPTTHVRAGKAQIDGKEFVALWFDDCSDPIQQATYINATKPSRLKEFLSQVREHLSQAIAEAKDAVAAEREACAKVCLEEAQEAYHQEAFYLPQGNPGLLRIAEGAKRCADAIRARGDHGIR